MLSRGFAVVDVGYRLSGEAIFPAPIQPKLLGQLKPRSVFAKRSMMSQRLMACRELPEVSSTEAPASIEKSQG